MFDHDVTSLTSLLGKCLGSNSEEERGVISEEIKTVAKDIGRKIESSHGAIEKMGDLNNLSLVDPVLLGSLFSSYVDAVYIK